MEEVFLKIKDYIRDNAANVMWDRQNMQWPELSHLHRISKSSDDNSSCNMLRGERPGSYWPVPLFRAANIKFLLEIISLEQHHFRDKHGRCLYLNLCYIGYEALILLILFLCRWHFHLCSSDAFIYRLIYRLDSIHNLIARFIILRFTFRIQTDYFQSLTLSDYNYR